MRGAAMALFFAALLLALHVPRQVWAQSMVPGDFLKAAVVESDRFGFEVAMTRLSSGDEFLFVGAPEEDSCPGEPETGNSCPQSGAVFVFRRTAAQAAAQNGGAGGWTQLEVLRTDETYPNFGRMGRALAVRGDFLAVGSPYGFNCGNQPFGGSEVDGSNTCRRCGSVTIYEYSGGSWANPRDTVRAPNPDLRTQGGGGPIGAEFGFSVDISGDGSLLVVGAPFEDSCVGPTTYTSSNPSLTTFDCGSEDSGAVFVYERNAANGRWLLRSARKETASTGSKFGWSVAFSPTPRADGRHLLMVGQPEYSSCGLGINSGDTAANSAGDCFKRGIVYAYLLTSDGSTWSSEHTLQPRMSPSPNGRFGSAIAIGEADASGIERVAVGAHYDYFCDSRIVNLAMGDPVYDTGSDSTSCLYRGAVHVYTFAPLTATFAEEALLKTESPGDDNGLMGRSIAVVGGGELIVSSGRAYNRIGPGAAGAANSAQDSGAIMVWERLFNGEWRHRAFQRADPVEAGDQFAYEVACMPDTAGGQGALCAAGSPFQDSCEAGINPTDRSNNGCTSSGFAQTFALGPAAETTGTTGTTGSTGTTGTTGCPAGDRACPCASGMGTGSALVCIVPGDTCQSGFCFPPGTTGTTGTTAAPAVTSSSPPPPPPPQELVTPPPPPADGVFAGGTTTVVVATLLICLVLCIAIAIVAAVVWRRRKQRNVPTGPKPEVEMDVSPEQGAFPNNYHNFPASDGSSPTGGFDDAKKPASEPFLSSAPSPGTEYHNFPSGGGSPAGGADNIYHNNPAVF